MTFDEKMESVKTKNGINTFGYSLEDLEIFTIKEIEKLNKSGIISDMAKSITKLKLLNKGS